MALFNDANDGSLFFIQHVEMHTDTADDLIMLYGSGPGTFPEPPGFGVNPINPLDPQPQGVIYTVYDINNTTWDLAETIPNRLDVTYDGNGGGPICVIPPGWALVLGNQGPGAMQFGWMVQYLIMPA